MDAISIPQLPDIISQDKLDQILIELRGIRLALVHLATQDGRATSDDFDLTSPSNQAHLVTQLS